MIHFTRVSSIAPGKVAEAMAYAAEMTEYLAGAHGQKMQLMAPVGGNPFRIGWYTSFENLAAMEAFTSKTSADAKFLSMMGKGAGLFIAGATRDEIWRSV